MKRTGLRTATTLVAICAACLTANAQEVGRFAVVQNQVTSLPAGVPEDQAVPARSGAPITLNEQERSGAASRAKMTFGEGAVISIGQNTIFTVTQEAVVEATGASVSTVDIALGKLRVFVSRFWGGRPEVQVDTPTAVVGIRGSEVLIEALEDGSTVVTVFSGSAEVESKSSSDSTSLTSGQQVSVGANGVMGGMSFPPEIQLLTLWLLTEPNPEAPRLFPSPRWRDIPVKTEQKTATECTTCTERKIVDPPNEVPPRPRESDAINSGSKSRTPGDRQ